MKPLVSFGNTKLHHSVMIFNMTTATECPANRLGLCKCADICYARKAEVRFPKSCLPYRERQHEFWKNHTAKTIADRLCGWARKSTKYFRYSEAGDFETQKDVDKMTYICAQLGYENELKCYGYTARHDLDLSELNKVSNVIVSGYDVENCAHSIVIEKESVPPKGWYVCPGKGCMHKCFACANRNIKQIAFRRH